MIPSQASAWYRRMSILYSLGAWTVLGSLFFYSRKESKPTGDDVEAQQKNASINELIEPPKGFYMETVVTYKEDFVPVTDRILNYLKSWTGGSES